MADTNQNSFSELIENFITLQNNAFLVLQNISESVTSEADSVSFVLSDIDGKTELTYNIPTYSYLKKYIDRIDNTIQAMLSMNESNKAVVRNADGSFSTLYKMNLNREPSKIVSVNVPKNFNAKPNWFFEDYLNPYIYVSFDVSDYVTQTDKRIAVKRILVNCNTPIEKEHFMKTYDGKNNISFNELIKDLESSGTTYIVDEEVKQLPIPSLKYSGKFVIVDTIDDLDSDTTTISRTYKFDKITYSENGIGPVDTLELAIGHKLIFKETIFEVMSVDKANYYVKLKKVCGYDGIMKGDELDFYSELSTTRTADVGIGYDEYEVVFFKSINDTDNIISSEWSDGVGFYTSTLTIQQGNEAAKTLSTYYNEEVYDFGQMIKGMIRENAIPAFYGEKPEAPKISPDNFQVVKINDHIYSSDELEDIKSKAATKNSLESEIAKIDLSIKDTKTILYNEDFTDANAKRDSYEKTLKDLISEKEAKAAQYSSIVKELNSKNIDGVASLKDPVYRIRGFFDMPAHKWNKSTGYQEVVQFEIAYEYLSVDGKPSKATQFDYTSPSSQTKEGTFSNWNYVKSAVRKRSYDEEEGIYKWEDVDITVNDEEKPNQIDIPITKGEKVRLKIRSLSEAGWPSNPVYSDWSDAIEIEFPNEFTVHDESMTAFDGIEMENSRVKFQEELTAMGVDEHLKDSSVKEEQYWSHVATSINSGFYKDGVIMSLFDKLTEMEATIKDLKAKIDRVKPVMRVTILDADGNTIEVQNGTTINLFAGYYTEEQEKMFSDAQDRVGAIITKEYTIQIENIEGSNLELISKFPGYSNEEWEERYRDTMKTETNPAWKRMRYNEIPLMYTLDAKELDNDSKYSQINYQSPQVLSQYMYGRYSDVSGMNELYGSAENETMSIQPDDTEATRDVAGVFCGYSYTLDEDGNEVLHVHGKSGNDAYSTYCVHTDCPILNWQVNPSQWSDYTLKSGKAWIENFTDPLSSDLLSKAYNEVKRKESGASEEDEDYEEEEEEISESAMKEAVFDKVQKVPAFLVDNLFYYGDTAKSKKQAIYEKSKEYYHKLGFYAHDKYLIGNKTCGAYLFCRPNDTDDLLTDGNDYLATRELKANADKISIPVIFQYRMQDYYKREGRYGGYNGKDVSASSYSKNFSYVRKIGFDLFEKDEAAFSFDIEVTAKCDKVTAADKSTKNSYSVSYKKKQSISQIKKV